MRTEVIQPRFMEFVPKELENGVLYVSKKFQVAAHLCCCGCGTKIVTPLHPTEYKLVERGGAVSLSPSIGNWNHPCQSHYWIRDNRVVWSYKMSKAAIQHGRDFDDAEREAYFDSAAWPWWKKASRSISTWFRAIGGKG